MAMLRGTFVLLAVIALGGTLTPAHAAVHPAVLAAPKSPANARKNIAVGRIDGPHSSKIRLQLMQALHSSPSFTVTDAEDLKTSAGKSAIAKMATTLSVDAVVLGKISTSMNLTLSVYRADGRLVDQVKVKGGTVTKLQSAIDDQFGSTIAPPLAHASGARLSGRSGVAAGGPVEEEAEEPAAKEAPKPEPAPEESPEPTPEKAEPEEPAAAKSEEESGDATDSPESAAASPKQGRTPFEFTAGLRGYSRHWAYTDLRGVRDPTYPRTLGRYRLGAAPALLANGVVYPGAFFSGNPIASNLGLMGGAELGIATATDYQRIRPDGSMVVTELKTQYQAWDIGLRGRIPIGPAELDLFVEYGSQSFVLRGDEGGNGLGPVVPDVQYRFVRPGGEARVRLGKISLAGHVAPRFLLTLHNVDLDKVWFPGAKGHGLDFGLSVGYGLTSFLDVIGGLDFVGYGFDFNGMPVDPVHAPILAGGATDYYESLFLALRVSLGGAPPK
jgi:hypothetical protein